MTILGVLELVWPVLSDFRGCEARWGSDCWLWRGPFRDAIDTGQSAVECNNVGESEVKKHTITDKPFSPMSPHQGRNAPSGRRALHQSQCDATELVGSIKTGVLSRVRRPEDDTLREREEGNEPSLRAPSTKERGKRNRFREREREGVVRAMSMRRNPGQSLKGGVVEELAVGLGASRVFNWVASYGSHPHNSADAHGNGLKLRSNTPDPGPWPTYNCGEICIGLDRHTPLLSSPSSSPNERTSEIAVTPLFPLCASAYAAEKTPRTATATSFSVPPIRWTRPLPHRPQQRRRTRAGKAGLGRPVGRPPNVKRPYRPEGALEDMPGLQCALRLFLESRMVEIDEFCRESDPGQWVFLAFALALGCVRLFVCSFAGDCSGMWSSSLCEFGEFVHPNGRFTVFVLSTIREPFVPTHTPTCPLSFRWPFSLAAARTSLVVPYSRFNHFLARRERVYFATGLSLIQAIKGLMSYEDEDLLNALTDALFGSLASVVHSGGVGWVNGMSDVERHAELVYAESLFEKALLGTVLNMRTAISIYRTLLAYIDAAYIDAFYAFYASSHPPSSPSSPSPRDPAIDQHFRSGVYLGMGMSHVVLILMAGKLGALVELFGLGFVLTVYRFALPQSHLRLAYDRSFVIASRRAVVVLAIRRPSRVSRCPPSTSRVRTRFRTPAHEGLRRPICDMSLLIFHLVISSFTFQDGNIPLASRILSYHLSRFPDGIFFLFRAGRLALIRGEPRKAIKYYERAIEATKGMKGDGGKGYGSLDFVSWWEGAAARLALWEVASEPEGASEGKKGSSEECWRVLERDSGWSKSIYAHRLAVCLLYGVERDEKASRAGAGDGENRAAGDWESGETGDDKEEREREEREKREKRREEAVGLMRRVAERDWRFSYGGVVVEHPFGPPWCQERFIAFLFVLVSWFVDCLASA
ncbi:hypothetical protein FA15DRAFT_661535 [Coprinopsis marcescibilis]|uniref:Uncharacterized protein n=1 Tax=Coprinopsis marcescibilis TaxID=230819 RepID=A0A5C3KC26_COPMA|nr:hypothetical protein FA15DRAFT_661535 [Coprinopsis marcescibilis]